MDEGGSETVSKLPKELPVSKRKLSSRVWYIFNKKLRITKFLAGQQIGYVLVVELWTDLHRHYWHIINIESDSTTIVSLEDSSLYITRLRNEIGEGLLISFA